MKDELSPAVPGRYSYACLLRLPQVVVLTGLSRSALYRLMASGDFPCPAKLGARSSAWPADEVSAWCAARIAERDAKGRAA